MIYLIVYINFLNKKRTIQFKLTKLVRFINYFFVYLYFLISTVTASTCGVCGNISTGSILLKS